jgi:hypothetical protein
MVDRSRSPTSGELLQRIVRLEEANIDLQRQVNRIEGDFLKEVEDTTRHISYLYRRLADFLWPVVHKVFPRFGEVMNQGEAILKTRPSSKDEQ